MSPCAGATEYERELISVDSPNVVQCVGEMTHEAEMCIRDRQQPAETVAAIDMLAGEMCIRDSLN